MNTSEKLRKIKSSIVRQEITASSWELNFLNDNLARAEKYGPATKFSEKQSSLVDKIFSRITQTQTTSSAADCYFYICSKENNSGFTYRVIDTYGTADELFAAVKHEIEHPDVECYQIDSLYLVKASKRIGKNRCIPNQFIQNHASVPENMKNSPRPEAKSLFEKIRATVKEIYGEDHCYI